MRTLHFHAAVYAEQKAKRLSKIGQGLKSAQQLLTVSEHRLLLSFLKSLANNMFQDSLANLALEKT